VGGKLRFTYLVGGEAGMGVAAAGRMLAKTFTRGGYFVHGMIDYPSLIRGGHNFYLATVSDERVWSQYFNPDIMIALNIDTIKKHSHRLLKGSGIITDYDFKLDGLQLADGVKIYRIPLTKIVKELKASLIVRNSVALGALMALIGFDLEILLKVIGKELGKHREIAEINIKAAKAGYEYSRSNFGVGSFAKIKPKGDSGNLVITGNEAVALGALRAGMKTYFAYPMTPASPILHFLALVQHDFDVVVVQPESEIAAINMAVGAWYAGSRSMVATSGGGFCLMTEALGQAAMTETPVVVVIAQRPGPSTGMPTYTSQGDLRFTIHASQGEFPRFVIAPGDSEEAFYLTVKAFNMAEKYQVPAIILTDKHLAESHATVPEFDLNKARVERGKIITGEYKGEEEYRRFKLTEDGISPMAIPGTLNAIVKVNSSEHNEFGYATANEANATRMMEKRFRKLRLMREEVENLPESVKIYGHRSSSTAIISWGSTKGAILEALKIIKERGADLKFIQVVFLAPFPEKRVREALKGVNKLILVENNYTGQLESLLREFLLRPVDERILKYNGRPFFPKELAEKILEVIK